MWLMRKLAPDFKTIADFRKDNIDCIKPVIKEFVYLCRGLGLFGAELIGVNGSKFRAVNSKQRNFNEEKLTKALKRLEEKIARYLGEMEANDCDEDGERWKLGDHENLEEKRGKLREKRQEYMQAQSFGERVVVEHTISKLKHFRIMANEFRNRLRHYDTMADNSVCIGQPEDIG